MAKQRGNIAALYCRLSRDDGSDAESNSIATQRMMLGRYAKEHGFQVYSEYIDDGFSGTSFERPDFKRMIADIEDGKIGIVICKDLSRLGRNNALVAYYTEMYFIEKSTRFIAVNDAIDTAKGDNEIMPFKSVINEYYARDISKKVRSAYRTRAMNGEHSCCRAPYGYLKSSEDKHKLVINEETAKYVRLMFRMVLEGSTIRHIAKRLYDAKVSNPTAYEFQRSGRYINKVDPACPWDWSSNTIVGILHSKVYIGHMVNHKQTKKSFKHRSLVNTPESEWIIIENTHEPLIDEDTFERVQSLMSVKKRTNIRHIDNIFAGLLICADCGKKLVYCSTMRTQGGGGGFSCDHYHHNVRAGADRLCTPHTIGYNSLCTAVMSNINNVIKSIFQEDDYSKSLSGNSEKSTDAIHKEIDRLRRRESELKIIISRAFERNSLGTISDDTFSDLYKGFQAEQKEIAAQIESIQSLLTIEDKAGDNMALSIEMAKKYTEATELTHEILLDFIEKIVVHEATGNRRTDRKQIIEIYYRFIGRLPVSEIAMTTLPDKYGNAI